MWCITSPNLSSKTIEVYVSHTIRNTCKILKNVNSHPNNTKPKPLRSDYNIQKDTHSLIHTYTQKVHVKGLKSSEFLNQEVVKYLFCNTNINHQT